MPPDSRRASSRSTAAAHAARSSALMRSHAMTIAMMYPGTSPNSPRICRLIVLSDLPHSRASLLWLSPAAFARICHGFVSIAGGVNRPVSSRQAINVTLNIFLDLFLRYV